MNTIVNQVGNTTKEIDDMINAWSKDSIDKGYQVSVPKVVITEQFHESIVQLIEAHEKKVVHI